MESITRFTTETHGMVTLSPRNLRYPLIGNALDITLTSSTLSKGHASVELHFKESGIKLTVPNPELPFTIQENFTFPLTTQADMDSISWNRIINPAGPTSTSPTHFDLVAKFAGKLSDDSFRVVSQSVGKVEYKDITGNGMVTLQALFQV